MEREQTRPKLTVIQGSRHKLEHELMKQMAQGKICKDAIENLRPKGELRLAYSRPILSEQEETAWLEFEDLNP